VVEYQPDGQLTAQLTTDIRGMALEFPPGLRSEINAALALALDRGPGQTVPAGRLSGMATIVRGAYREPLAVVTGLLTTLRTRRLAAAAEPSPFLDALQLDVRLITDEDIIVNNNYGRFQLGGDLRVIGTAAAPALSGRAELREGGQLFVGRNVYTVNFGTIDFANPVTIEPNLNVEAATRAGGEDIEVTIKGTPETISVDLRSSSNPDLGQAEIASLLATGRRLEDLDPTDAAFIGTQVLGNFSAEVLGFAGRAFGLDTLRLGGVENAALRRDPTAVATETDPTTRLTFGKSLGSDVDVTFSQSLRDSAAQTWIVDYLPARRLELRLVSGDDDLRSYGFRHDMTFGGGVERSGQPAVAAPARREVRVVAVNIKGDLAVPEARVRDVLRLGPGDRFDFGAWQADRDRVEDLYRRSGYLVARVMATRDEAPEGVTLTYEIASGPQATMVATGIDLDRGLRSQLEAAWANSFFDEFLVDEATRIVKDALGRAGYLRAMVTARVTGSETMRTLEIVVDRGPQTSRTSVRIEGTTPALADEINAVLSMRGLVERAVIDPGSLEREVTAHLRTKGYLRARVTAGAPLFEGATAVVPLTVDSGSVFTVGTVTFDGGGALPIAMVRDTANVMEGAPFDPAVPDAARDRLVALYRREGFPTPAVTVKQAIRTDAIAVDIAFAIEEGPRQVIGEIVVSGNRAIDSDVIVRALGLRMNEPLRAVESLQARARVFDTGLFRRVDVAAEPLNASPIGFAPQAQNAGTQSPVAQTLSGLRDTPMRLRVTVEEWPALRLRYGVQVAEERPEGKIEGRDLVPGLSADLTRRTLFGRAIGIGGALAFQRREQRGRLFLNAPTLAGWPVESSMVLERSRETFSAVSLVTQKQGISWEQRTRVGRALSLSYAYRFERNHTFDTAPPRPEFPQFDITINIARITPTAAWDTRDDPYDTTRGSLFSSTLEWAPESAGSDIRFIRELVQAYSFHPWRNMVFASAARFGVVQPLGGQELIISERFFAGGDRTVRGVAEDSLGARDFFGDPTGGQAMLVLNQEVRVPIYKWLRGVGFVDAGNVFARASDLRIGDLVGSIGVGVRLATPFALLRADVARAVGAGPREQGGRFIFGIGHAF
jgi:outer membrane protein insertion porin family